VGKEGKIPPKGDPYSGKDACWMTREREKNYRNAAT